MKVLLIGIAACAVLFVAGALYPPWSRKLQSLLRRFSKKGEARGDSSGGKLGDWTKDALKRVRRSSDKSVQIGRRVNRKARDAFR